MKGIITICREYGSGGRLIAQKAADRLGVPFYDKQLIARVAQKGGYAIEYVEETGEYAAAGSLLFGLTTGGAYYHGLIPGETISNADKIYILQSRIIEQIAQEGPCVIVGRSAGYILRERGDVLNVFVHADLEHKTGRAVEYFGIAPEDVPKELKKRDKLRAAHHRHYTDQQWDKASNYHLAVDSGRFGIDGSVAVILEAAERAFAGK